MSQQCWPYRAFRSSLGIWRHNDSSSPLHTKGWLSSHCKDCFPLLAKLWCVIFKRETKYFIIVWCFCPKKNTFYIIHKYIKKFLTFDINFSRYMRSGKGFLFFFFFFKLFLHLSWDHAFIFYNGDRVSITSRTCMCMYVCIIKIGGIPKIRL